jgi:Leucine-rich repeat (LRR) protein
MKISGYRLLFFAVISILLVGGCAKVTEPNWQESEYGYVQFKLYKEASYTEAKAEVSQLEYLNDVSKIQVNLRYGENEITQTLVMNSSSAETAEFGLRSDKLKLLAGTYKVQTFVLYDKLDEKLYTRTPSEEFASFEVVRGGLCVHDLIASAVERGKVRFTLVKDMSDFDETPQVKAAERTYTFDEIEYITLDIKSGTGVKTTFDKIPADFSLHFDETDDVEDGYRTSSLQCDSLLSLRAGNYTVESYAVFDSGKKLLEFNDKVETGFVVEDNLITEAEVPVALHESDDYIRDYYALYRIWEALDGKNWHYYGEDFPTGANWEFNKDCDLWGDQPGVSLHSNGRVARIDISGFGFSGHMPAELGDLTELVELYLGSHNDTNMSDYKDPDNMSGLSRLDRHKAYMSSLHPVTQMAEPVARALAENGISIPETAMYQTMTESEIIDRKTGGMRIQPKDMISGTVKNGLLSLPKEIGNLTKLEQLYIANSKISSLPDELENLVSCTDMEIYNCPEMREFPTVLAKMPELVSLNLANNMQWNSDEALEGIKALATGPSREKIQILYFNQNRLQVIPEEFTNFKKIGLIDFASNEIHTIETPWGNDIKPVQLYLDHNKLKEFPVDEKGVFCYMEDTETFSVKYNEFTEFPNIFDSGALYGIVSVDFSYNHISGFPKDFRGIFVQTLTIANNPEFTKYPVELAESNSIIMNINFRGCNINEIPKGAFDYENAIQLASFDFSYNDLDDLPWEMHAGNVPYLYGVELSYNRFREFPWEPLDSQYLTVFAIRGQRDENGERCLSDWPEGIYEHRGLRGFYIGSNNLGKIEDTISTICYYLDISDNPDIVFDASDICYAYQAGAYILIYDKTQNILNCDYMLN